MPKRPRTIMPLSVRQQQIIQLLVTGNSYAQVAAILDLSEKTIGKHIQVARKKYGVRTSYEMIAYAVKLGDVVVSIQAKGIPSSNGFKQKGEQRCLK